MDFENGLPKRISPEIAEYIDIEITTYIYHNMFHLKNNNFHPLTNYEIEKLKFVLQRPSQSRIK